ncbi:glycosyl transferase family 4 [Candidatus Pacearchaeota archaeon]|nr:glycosyl transferase family 4 [Candidatus Pacearchaeota archaeon]
MNLILFVAILTSFFCTLLAMPFWIRKAKEYGLEGIDKHKTSSKKIAEAGGMMVVFGFVLGVLIYIGIKTFYLGGKGIFENIFAILCVILLASLVGIMDDFFGWKKGLSRRSRIILITFAAIPLMVINAGESTMMGIEFGILYPLLLIPIGILGATTTFNFLAGYNGLEAGQGIIILSALSIVTYITGNSWLSVIGGCMVASLLAFYIFNKYPAKVFPGDVLTYSVGALIACMAILGNIEKIAIFFFIPYLMEVGLKLRGRLKKQSFAKVNNEGYLEINPKEIYGLGHLAIYLLKKIKPNKKVREKEVVWLIHGFQIVIIVLGFLLFIK